ncbi:MAG: hypothetical protein JXN10_09860 [Clostridia bacterium]|nr:hypothetical protein [Clostridia bacterium]
MKKVFWIIAAAVFVTLVLFFFPYKLATRIDFDEYKGNKVEGSILFYDHPDDNIRFEILDQSAADELLDYLGSLRGIRSFKGNEFPPPETDHMIDFYLSDKDGNVPLLISINGRSIQTNLRKKFQIFPKNIDIQVIDEMIADFLTEKE